jgi:hypothetical protein
MLCMQHNCQCHNHVTITFVHGWSHQATSKLVSARVGSIRYRTRGECAPLHSTPRLTIDDLLDDLTVMTSLVVPHKGADAECLSTNPERLHISTSFPNIFKEWSPVSDDLFYLGDGTNVRPDPAHIPWETSSNSRGNRLLHALDQRYSAHESGAPGKVSYLQGFLFRAS